MLTRGQKNQLGVFRKTVEVMEKNPGQAASRIRKKLGIGEVTFFRGKHVAKEHDKELYERYVNLPGPNRKPRQGHFTERRLKARKNKLQTKSSGLPKKPKVIDIPIDHQPTPGNEFCAVIVCSVDKVGALLDKIMV